MNSQIKAPNNKIISFNLLFKNFIYFFFFYKTGSQSEVQASLNSWEILLAQDPQYRDLIHELKLSVLKPGFELLLLKPVSVHSLCTRLAM